MQPNPEVRQSPSTRDRVRDGGCADHEACRGENAAPVRLFDGGVDRFAETEVIRCNNQPVQGVSSGRWRCEEKTSPSSRRRRTAYHLGPDRGNFRRRRQTRGDEKGRPISSRAECTCYRS
jgi:hypothetical protein